jgi:SulP family sulfate permease
MFVPKSIVCFREGYDRARFLRDLTAGVVVGIIALPLALAFAIASGVEPQRGLFTAIVAGFLISALGGSRVQIGGPTGAFVVIVYGIVTKYGYDGLAAATIMAGIILVVLGLVRLGALMKFIPYPVITGFTSGIAVIIFSSQIKDLLGLKMGAVPVGFLEKWQAYAGAFSTLDPTTAAVGLTTLLILIVWPKVSKIVPGPFVAMIAITAAVGLLDLDVATIGSRFGEIPQSLPAPSLPRVTMAQFRELVSPAVTIALLAAIESLLSAVVADGMIGTRHKSNMELVAQGVANIASPLFGGIPATGAIARTATNIKTGGRTPLAGMIHAVTLLLILLFAGRWAAKVPLAVLAAILVVVSYHMSEWRSFASLLRAPKSDIAVLLLTFFLTVLVDLTVAVQVGVVVAALLFMKRMSEVTNVQGITTELRDGEENAAEITGIGRGGTQVGNLLVPKGVDVYEVSGPFFFGAADKMREVLSEVSRRPKVLIIRMRHVPSIDATGLHALEQLAKRCEAKGIALILSEVAPQPMRTIVRSRKFGRQNLAKSFEVAVDYARSVLR